MHLLAQAGTGLVSDDEISFTGPLKLVSNQRHRPAGHLVPQTVRAVAGRGLVVLHAAAILVLPGPKRRDNLIRPMLNGDKQGGMQVPTSRDDGQTRLLAAVIFSWRLRRICGPGWCAEPA